MDIETDAVAQPMDEIIAQAGLFDDRASDLVDGIACYAWANDGDGGLLGVADDGIGPPNFVIDLL